MNSATSPQSGATPLRTGFGDRLAEAVESRGPLCAGLDPTPELLESWGLGDSVDGLRRFCEIVTEAWADRIAVLKPQSAYFERHGSAGVAVLEEVLHTWGSTSSLTILDAKRCDIGPTLAAYAQAYLADDAPLAVDALTLSPYLGYESLRPAIDLAAGTGRGVFVLALTSNPEGASLQHHGSPSVAATIVQQAARDNASSPTAGATRRAGPVGVVIGATVGAAPGHLGIDLPGLGGWILAPGLGAQGGHPEDLAATFAGALHRVLPVVSRAVLAAGPDVSALRAAADRWNQDLRGALAP